MPFVFVVATAGAVTLARLDASFVVVEPTGSGLTPELLERIDRRVFESGRRLPDLLERVRTPDPWLYAEPFFDRFPRSPFDRSHRDVFSCQGHRAPPVSVELSSEEAPGLDPASRRLGRPDLRHRRASRRQRVPLRSRPGARPLP